MKQELRIIQNREALTSLFVYKIVGIRKKTTQLQVSAYNMQKTRHGNSYPLQKYI